VEETVACAFCVQAHADLKPHERQPSACSRLAGPIVYEKEQHHFHIQQFRKAALYDVLEDTFGCLFFHRAKLVLFAAIMQHAHSSARDPINAPIVRLPRDVFVVIFDLLLDALMGTRPGSSLQQVNTHFTGPQYTYVPSQLNLYLKSTPAPDLYTYLFTHRCLALNPCPLPGCNRYFSTSGEVATHMSSECERYRFPCPACGMMLSRAEFATHEDACPYKCVMMMPGATNNAKDRGGKTYDEMCGRDRTCYLHKSGKVKRVDGDGVEVICKDFPFKFDSSFNESPTSRDLSISATNVQGGLEKARRILKEKAGNFNAMVNLVDKFDGYNRLPY
jgi:hypothetical protein